MVEVKPQVSARSGVMRGAVLGAVRGAAKCLRGHWGGCKQNERGGCEQTPFHFSLSLFGFFVLDRHDQTAPAEREWTGATPPF